MAEQVLNLLLLRGLVREQRHWAEFPSSLQKVLPHLSLHFLDLPGIGTEVDRDSPNSISAIMEDLRKRWVNIRDQHEGRWALFSISLGSMIALEWASKYPKDFEWISLMNTSSIDSGHFWDRLRPKALLNLYKITRAKSNYERESYVLQMTTHNLKNAEVLAKQWAKISLPASKARRIALAQIVAALKFRAPEVLDVPSCIFIGLEDRMVSPSCSRLLAKKLFIEIIEHPTAGHDICLDDPRWVAEKLKSWLLSQSFLDLA